MRQLTENEPRSVCVLFSGLFAKQAGYCTRNETIDCAGIYQVAWRRGHHTYYEINSGIATKCSKKVEQYSTGYELWYAKVLVKK